MAFVVHKKEGRGFADFGWLQANYSFSFANHYNPQRMGFGKLLVLNDDIIAPNNGFPTHSHNDMEIISIPLEGALAHKDSTGAQDTTNAGEIQVMSAGTGMSHSEYNPSTTKETHSLQLWIHTKEQGLTPRYDKGVYTLTPNKLTVVVSGEEDDAALYIHQDAKIFLAELEPDKIITHTIRKGWGVYLFVIRGEILVNDETLYDRDAIGLYDEDTITITAKSTVKILLVETIL